MSKKFLCVMAGYDSCTEKYLAAIQDKLYKNGFVGTHTKDLPQHITLGTFPVEEESEVIDLVTHVANEVSLFNITFNHVGLFQGGNVLFIAPDPNHDLIKLKENFGTSFNWTPHTTMLIDNEEVIYRALPKVVESFKAFKGKVENIHLYEFWPTRHILTLSFVKE